MKTLLITRPSPKSQQLLEDVRERCLLDFEAVVSPLIDVVSTSTTIEITGSPDIVFTSVNGVRYADLAAGHAGLRAWCVGDETAKAATGAGFDAVSAGGAADELVALILSKARSKRFIHVRGNDTRGEVASRLNDAGLDCTEVVAYRQNYPLLSAEAKSILSSHRHVVVPLYSPKTAESLRKQGTYFARLHVIGISDSVAEVLSEWQHHTIEIVKRPTHQAMVAAICAALGGK